MLIRQDDGFHHPVASEITPAQVYAKRRDFLQQLAAAGLLASAGGAWAQSAVPRPGKLAPLNSKSATFAGAQATDTVTPYKDASTYNNFYEFGTDKSDPAENAHTLKTRPWSVDIEGQIHRRRACKACVDVCEWMVKFDEIEFFTDCCSHNFAAELPAF